ncbi:hypothetical protein A2U01_0115163 [Trifolium medium]|uniref:Uncharacterized protein n=1 Tax=Trifolium medium TaxID=97028 RepID=A0A392W4M7_9FABA|nr:hypothetical protein [Trifolium medium]
MRERLLNCPHPGEQSHVSRRSGCSQMSTWESSCETDPSRIVGSLFQAGADLGQLLA